MHILTLRSAKLDSFCRYSFYVNTSKFCVSDCCLVTTPYQDTKIKAGHVKCIITSAGNISLQFGDYTNHDQARFQQRCTFRSPRHFPPEKETNVQVCIRDHRYMTWERQMLGTEKRIRGYLGVEPEQSDPQPVWRISGWLNTVILLWWWFHKHVLLIKILQYHKPVLERKKDTIWGNDLPM